MKKLICIILALVMLFGMSVNAFAEGTMFTINVNIDEDSMRDYLDYISITPSNSGVAGESASINSTIGVASYKVSGNQLILTVNNEVVTITANVSAEGSAKGIKFDGWCINSPDNEIMNDTDLINSILANVNFYAKFSVGTDTHESCNFFHKLIIAILTRFGAVRTVRFLSRIWGF